MPVLEDKPEWLQLLIADLRLDPDSVEFDMRVISKRAANAPINETCIDERSIEINVRGDIRNIF